jgi:hypothetical protein
MRTTNKHILYSESNSLQMDIMISELNHYYIIYYSAMMYSKPRNEQLASQLKQAFKSSFHYKD